MTVDQMIDLLPSYKGKIDINLLLSKSNDYSSNGDILSVFKIVAKELTTTPETVIKILIEVKKARLQSLRKKIAVNHESIEDTLTDLGNYEFLLYCSKNEL